VAVATLATNAVLIQTNVALGSQIVIVGETTFARKWIYIVVNKDI
jgi:hypothetical protein